jgi:hypothetical protein
MDAITGLKALGVRELNYKLIFMAQYVQVRSANTTEDDENEVQGLN